MPPGSTGQAGTLSQDEIDVLAASIAAATVIAYRECAGDSGMGGARFSAILWKKLVVKSWREFLLMQDCKQFP